jgi:hypothetical protein
MDAGAAGAHPHELAYCHYAQKASSKVILRGAFYVCENEQALEKSLSGSRSLGYGPLCAGGIYNYFLILPRSSGQS